MKAAFNGGLQRSKSRRLYFEGGGREFNEAVVRRLEDRGLLFYDPMTQRVWARER